MNMACADITESLSSLGLTPQDVSVTMRGEEISIRFLTPAAKAKEAEVLAHVENLKKPAGQLQVAKKRKRDIVLERAMRRWVRAQVLNDSRYKLLVSRIDAATTEDAVNAVEDE
jgi:hypothetical protein